MQYVAKGWTVVGRQARRWMPSLEVTSRGDGHASRATTRERQSNQAVRRQAIGFIREAQTGVCSFVHQVDVERQAPLRRGFVVSYVPTMTPKGARAADVVIEDERAADLDGR